MRNIIKALNYKTLRDNVTYYAFLSIIVSFVMNLGSVDGILSLSGSEYFAESSVATVLPVSLFLVILVTRICGWDYTDKTMNYELLIGHGRKEVFFSRIWVSFIWCVPTAIAIIALPPVVLTLINGWGIYMDMSDMIFRCFIACFTILRMYCELVLLTFLTKSCYIGLITGYIFIEIGAVLPMAIEEIAGIKLGNYVTLISSGNFLELMILDKYGFQYVNGKDELLYDVTVDPTFAAATIIVSLVAGTACILISWLYFRKSDMK